MILIQNSRNKDEDAIQGFLTEDPACLNVRQEEEPNLTVAELLAEENQVEAVDFLIAHNPDIDIIHIALAYTRAGNHDRAEQFLLDDDGNDQLANNLAWTYARAGNHERVKHYIKTHKVNPDAVIQGYAEGDFYRKAEHYFSLITDEEERARVRDLLAWVCARRGNQQEAEYYVNHYAAFRETIINGYVAGGHDDLVDALLQNDNQPDYVDEAVWRYASDGKHDKVEEFLERYPNLSRQSIAGGYSQAGDDERAALYQVPSVQEEIDQEKELEKDGEMEMTPTLDNALPAFRLSLSSVEEGEAENDGEEERAETTHTRFLSSSAEESDHGAFSDEDEQSSLGSATGSEGEAESDGEEEHAETTDSEDDRKKALPRRLSSSSAEESDHSEGEEEDNLGDEPAPGSNNGNSQPSNNQSLHGIDMQVLSLFVAGVGATAVAAAIVALALHAITLPVGLTIVTVGVVAAGLGGFGFFKYAPQVPAASAAANAMGEQEQPPGASA